jgi:hypothetical protein
MFGIALTMLAAEPLACCKVAMLMPAQIDNTLRAPLAVAAAQVAAAMGGFTAMTTDSHAAISASTVTPGNILCNSMRLSGETSTTVIAAGDQLLAIKPLIIAAPILPPPTKQIGESVMIQILLA